MTTRIIDGQPVNFTAIDKSSTLASYAQVDFGPDRHGDLLLEFKNSGIYRYKEVDSATVIDFIEAPSKGKFFAAKIRDNFEHSKIDLEITPQIASWKVGIEYGPCSFHYHYITVNAFNPEEAIAIARQWAIENYMPSPIFTDPELVIPDPVEMTAEEGLGWTHFEEEEFNALFAKQVKLDE